MINDFKNFVAAVNTVCTNNYAIVKYIELHFAFGICTFFGICGRDIIDYCVLKIKACYAQATKIFSNLLK